MMPRKIQKNRLSANSTGLWAVKKENGGFYLPNLKLNNSDIYIDYYMKLIRLFFKVIGKTISLSIRLIGYAFLGLVLLIVALGSLNS